MRRENNQYITAPKGYREVSHKDHLRHFIRLSKAILKDKTIRRIDTSYWKKREIKST